MGSYYLGVIYAGVVFKETRIMAGIMDWESYDANPAAQGIRFSCGRSRFFMGGHVLLVLTTMLSCQTVTQETLQEHIDRGGDYFFGKIQVYRGSVIECCQHRDRQESGLFDRSGDDRELAFKVVVGLTVVNDLEVQEGHSL